MNQIDVSSLLAHCGALLTDSHIVYTSGKHGSSYFNKDAIYPHTAAISDLCHLFAEYFFQDHIDVVIAPALGGIILSQWTAYHLSKLCDRDILALYAEKIEGTKDFVIKRGYDKLLAKKNVLVLEDVLTTGGSVKKVIELVRSLGGHVVGLGVLCNRGGITQEEIGHIPKLQALISLNLQAWESEKCPFCSQGIPINMNVGKGREFLEQKKKSY